MVFFPRPHLKIPPKLDPLKGLGNLCSNFWRLLCFTSWRLSVGSFWSFESSTLTWKKRKPLRFVNLTHQLEGPLKTSHVSSCLKQKCYVQFLWIFQKVCVCCWERNGPFNGGGCLNIYFCQHMGGTHFWAVQNSALVFLGT